MLSSQWWMCTGTAMQLLPSPLGTSLVWKDTEMPDGTTRAKDLAAFQAELADVLDWETAQISTKEGIIYT
jgi:hypothetical protein